MTGRFRDRRDAGVTLAALLGEYAGRDDVVVLGVPRGGVPVAREVATALRAPLDAFSVRKLGAPGREELAMGAIATGGVRVLNHDVLDALGIPRADVERVAAREAEELTRRERSYREGRLFPVLDGRIVILIDDGVATGASMFAAIAALRAYRPARIVVAVPVGPQDTCAALRAGGVAVVCAFSPEPFGGVGAWYEDFGQTTDEEVRALLR